MGVDIEAVKKAIGIADFKQTKRLEIALTHSSYIYENQNLNRQQQDLQERDYRRLAVLGDSILGAVVIDYLYDRLPTANQGTLTNWKSDLVSRNKAFEFAHKLKLRQLCQIGGSERGKDESQQIDLLGEMFEALLGAIYLEFARDFSRIRNWLIDHFIKQAVDDLFTYTQRAKEQLPEDCLQAVSMMEADEATELLWRMKQKADALVAKDEKLQQLLTWINNKSFCVEPNHKQAFVRAFYLALIRLLGLAFVRNFDPARGGSKARQFALSFNRARNIARDIALDLAFNANPNSDPANVLVSVFVLDLEPELKQVLQKLESELPDPKEERDKFEVWRKAKGQDWLKEIITVLGHDLQFTDEQKELLKEYYDANKLLLECLNSASNLAPEVREKILESLFLPR